ncbi:glycosyltransferase, partial [Patescibacteria group bacterium]|nr:glycosyltransferase [Patescibacteria group bacterium]
EYSGSYLIERPARELTGGLKIIHGSVYMARKEAIKEVGWGTSITEDFELTLKLYEKGYKVVFTPYVQAPAECVSTLKRLFRQRMRWAEGHSNNVRKMYRRLMFGHWKTENRGQKTEERKRTVGFLSPSSVFRRQSSPNGRTWVPSSLSFIEKLEFLYLSPYYLQAALFLVGNISWLIAELVFRVRLPFWTSIWGWSMVLTNLFALPLMNAVGLYIEESEKKDYAGILSFIALCYLVVPFQAYASVKGFLEKEEGTWFRTPKTGNITFSLAKSQFARLIKIFFPLGRKEETNTTQAVTAITETRQSALSFFQQTSNLVRGVNVRRGWFRVGRPLLASLLIINTILLSLAPGIPFSATPVHAKPFDTILDQQPNNQATASYQPQPQENKGEEIKPAENNNPHSWSSLPVPQIVNYLGKISTLKKHVQQTHSLIRNGLSIGQTLVEAKLKEILFAFLHALYTRTTDPNPLQFTQSTSRNHFQARETPEFTFQLAGPTKRSKSFISSLLDKLLEPVHTPSLGKIEASLYDYAGKEASIELKTSQTDGQSVSISIPSPVNLKPGVYTVKVEANREGKTYTQEQDFTWGVLAINTNKSIYLSSEALAKEGLPPEIAKLAMAVLDEKGKMVCDALLRLEVKASQGKPSIFTTEDGTIRVNPECEQKAFTLNPDYEAEYQVDEAGIYEITLTAETASGIYTIQDSIEVRDSVAFDIERHTATRIYPVEMYPMNLTINVNEDFSGFVEETVPAGFDIQSAGESLLLQETIDGNQPNSDEPQLQRFLGIQTNQDSTKIIKGDNIQKIRWQVDWKAGSTHHLGYFFGVPELSPAFFLLGPLKFYKSPVFAANVIQGQSFFEEARQWQLAIDAVETRYMRGVASEVTVNGLTTYSLGTSQSSTHQSNYVERTGSGTGTAQWGIKVWKRSSGGSETEITSGTPVAIVSRSSDGADIQSNTWTPTQTAMTSTDSIVVRVYGEITDYVSWTEMAVFTTEQLGANQLDNATWTVYYYTERTSYGAGPPSGRWVRGTFHWGDSTYNSRITNFSWSEPAVTTVSGTVYLDNESTIATLGNGGPCNDNTIVAIRVDGGSETTGTCTAAGATYSIEIATQITSGQTVTVYLTSTDKANTIYVSDGGATDTGIDLFLETVIVRDDPDDT